MDINALRLELAERYPQWRETIRVLELRESPEAKPVDNDGQRIKYNGRLLRELPEESQRFYLAQQLLHIQLAHAARGEGKEPETWKRASDAVVNAMLLEDGFSLPEGLTLPPEAIGRSAEETYSLLLGYHLRGGGLRCWLQHVFVT